MSVSSSSSALPTPCTTEDARAWIRQEYTDVLTNKKAICPVCLDLFSETIATATCGHTFCYSCWVKLAVNMTGLKPCPMCRHQTVGCKKGAAKLNEIKFNFVCKACKSETVFSTLTEFVEHIKLQCPEMIRKCLYCPLEFTLKETKHDECPNETIVCKQCPDRVSVRRKDMATHLSTVCGGAETKCDQCGLTCPRYKLQDHGCPEQRVACEYSHMGCKCESMKRKDMTLHVLKPETMQAHMSLLHERLKKVDQYLQLQSRQPKGWLSSLF